MTYRDKRTRYELAIYDATGVPMGKIANTGIAALRMNRAVNEVGALALTLNAQHPLAAVIGRDYLIDVQRAQGGRPLAVEDTFRVTRINPYRDPNNEFVTFTGQSLLGLLGTRIIVPEDDPLEAGGFSTKDGFAHDVIAAYVIQQAGAGASVGRVIPRLTVNSSVIDPPPPRVGARLRYENLLKVAQDLANQGGIIMNMQRQANGDLLLKMTAPVNRTERGTSGTTRPAIVFAPELGNANEPSLVRQYDGKGNFVYMQGQGQDEQRQLVKQFNSDASATPYARLEYTDTSNAKKGELLQLVTDANTSLVNNMPRDEFTFTIDPNQPNAEYGVLYNLGDLVSVRWIAQGYADDLQVQNVEFELSEGIETLVITTGRYLKNES